MIKFLYDQGLRSPLKKRKGSHQKMVDPNDHTRRTVVPMHSELDRGLTKEILRQAKISEETFLDSI